MPDNTAGSGTNITENPLLAKLISEGAATAMTLRGYIGPSSNEAVVTLYQNLDDLSQSIEIARSDIIHSADVPDSVLPHGAKILWVKNGASIVHRRVETVGSSHRAQATQQFVERRAGRLRMQVRALHCPPYCTSVCGSPPPCHSSPVCHSHGCA